MPSAHQMAGCRCESCERVRKHRKDYKARKRARLNALYGEESFLGPQSERKSHYGKAGGEK